MSDKLADEWAGVHDKCQPKNVGSEICSLLCTALQRCPGLPMADWPEMQDKCKSMKACESGFNQTIEVDFLAHK